MEAKKQVKNGDLFNKRIDMSKVKLDDVKPKINKIINNIFQIQKFIYNELKLEQFISPMKMHIHITEFLNGPLVRQFMCELWPILLAAEESATSIANDTVEPKKDDFLKKVIQTKDCKRSQSRKQGKVMNGGKEPLVPSTTSASTHKPQGHVYIEKDEGSSTKVELKQKPDKENNKNSGNQEIQICEQVNDDGTGVVTCGLGDFANVCMYSPQQKDANVILHDQRPSTPFREFLTQHSAEMDEFLCQWSEAPDKETILLSNKFVYPDETKSENQSPTTFSSHSKPYSKPAESPPKTLSASDASNSEHDDVSRMKTAGLNANLQNQCPCTPFREFLLEQCAELDEFLKCRRRPDDFYEIKTPEKLKNIIASAEGQAAATVLPPPSVTISDERDTNSDETVKLISEMKAAPKRKYSTMINESKKSKNNSTNKDEQKPATEKQIKAMKSSSKSSSDKNSSSKKKTHRKYSKATRERMLELFGNYSSDEEECRVDEDRS